MKYFRVILNSFLLLILVYPAFSNSNPGKKPLLQGKGTGADPYIIPKTVSAIKINGRMEAKEWDQALHLDILYETWPGENTPAPVRTEAYLTYDNSNLYVAFRAFDPDRSKLRAYYYERDNLWYDDFVVVFMDTFNDERRTYGFRSNPYGVQGDNILTRTNPNVIWDAIYKSAGKIYDWGYTAEMAIPFNQLRFQHTKQDQVWGINVRRIYPRDTLYIIDHIKLDRSNYCLMCQFIKIKGFKGVRPGRNLEIVPTLTFNRTDDRQDFPEGNFQKRDQEIEAGLTAMWGFTPNMTLNAAINPDFSQVEADALKLDINEPFALSYEERRPFFCEGSDFFSSNFNAVYTRTMRDPSWGIKLTGKEGANTIGAYVVRDTLTNLVFPGSHSSDAASLSTANISSVLRYKRDFGKNYTLGLLATDREGQDYFNRMVGLDGEFRFTRKDRVQLQFLGSSTRYPDDVAREFAQDEGAFAGTALEVKYNHNARNLDFSAGYQDLSGGFRADLGFIPQVNVRRGEATAAYTWIGRRASQGKPGTWYRQLALVGTFAYCQDQEGNPVTSGGNLELQFDGPLQSILITRATKLRETYNQVEFDQLGFLVYAEMKPNRRLEITFRGIFGDRIDYDNTRLGQRVMLNPLVVLKPGQHLRLNYSHIYERLHVETGRVYTANISQLTGIYHLNVNTFFRAILQYRDIDRNAENYLFPIESKSKYFFTQLLFSYKINPRTVIFLGYSDNYYGTRAYQLTQKDRTFFIKLSYAWTL